jgi:hypothetical protein
MNPRVGIDLEQKRSRPLEKQLQQTLHDASSGFDPVESLTEMKLRPGLIRDLREPRIRIAIRADDHARSGIMPAEMAEHPLQPCRVLMDV